jgi:hypothetical protein
VSPRRPPRGSRCARRAGAPPARPGTPLRPARSDHDTAWALPGLPARARRSRSVMAIAGPQCSCSAPPRRPPHRSSRTRSVRRSAEPSTAAALRAPDLGSVTIAPNWTRSLPAVRSTAVARTTPATAVAWYASARTGHPASVVRPAQTVRRGEHPPCRNARRRFRGLRRHVYRVELNPIAHRLPSAVGRTYVTLP